MSNEEMATLPDVALSKAAGRGDLVAMHAARGQGATDVDWALYWAAEAGQLDAMRLLHDDWGAQGVNVALHWAARAGQTDAMRLLVDEWCATSVNKALYWAIHDGQSATADFLRDEWGASLRKGVALCKTDTDSEGGRQVAAGTNDDIGPIVTYLLGFIVLTVVVHLAILIVSMQT